MTDFARQLQGAVVEVVSALLTEAPELVDALADEMGLAEDLAVQAAPELVYAGKMIGHGHPPPYDVTGPYPHPLPEMPPGHVTGQPEMPMSHMTPPPPMHPRAMPPPMHPRGMGRRRHRIYGGGGSLGGVKEEDSDAFLPWLASQFLQRMGY